MNFSRESTRINANKTELQEKNRYAKIIAASKDFPGQESRSKTSSKANC
jgi:hypothetical protein